VFLTIFHSVNQSVNYIDDRVKTTTDIVTKMNTNKATIKQGVALTARNTTNPLSLAAPWCAVECYRHRQTTDDDRRTASKQ